MCAWLLARGRQYTIPEVLRAVVYCWPRRGAGQAVPDSLSLAEEARWLTEQSFLIGDVNIVGLDEVRGRNPSVVVGYADWAPCSHGMYTRSPKTGLQDASAGRPSAHHVFQAVTAQASATLRQCLQRAATPLDGLHHWTVRCRLLGQAAAGAWGLTATLRCACGSCSRAP